MLLFVIGLLAFFIVINFFDSMFKSCLVYPYLQFLKYSNLSIRLGQIKWKTRLFNKTLQSWGLRRRKFNQYWFGIGAIVSCISILFAFYLMLATIWTTIKSRFTPTNDAVILKPLLPGVNLPYYDLGYYFLTLFLCSVFHELGHALAAAKERLKIQSTGAFLVLIFPGAFVELCPEQMNLLSQWQQLKIYCAGVWHNIVLTIFAFLLLYSIPFLMPLFYIPLEGALHVINVPRDSGLNGPAGLIKGDLVTAINSCPINDLSSWQLCVLEATQSKQSGYCVDMRNENFELPENCCQQDSASGICFGVEKRSGQKVDQCLPVRKMLQLSTRLCLSVSDCQEGFSCIVPQLPTNMTRLIQISLLNKESVLFFGNPQELQFVELGKWMSRLRIFPVWISTSLQRILRFVIMFSSALAILNVVPCVNLDGQYIIKTLVIILAGPYLKRHQMECIILFLMLSGTLLMIANLVVGAINLMYL